MKTYFKGSSGIISPIDINGKEIIEGSVLTRDYGDYESYMNKSYPEEYKEEPFYIVKKKESGYYAESIKPIVDNPAGERFYLHDFRFKYCRVID